MGVSTILEPIARWRVSGDCTGPQGADGVAVLARSAYDDMLAAAWERDDSAPTMPVHDYARTRPQGQAYKALYGYDADSRAQRSCCGAACYTYRIPDDALDQTAAASYVQTEDEEPVEGKTYYTRSGSDPYTYAEVESPDASAMDSYWELEFPGGVATIASVTAKIAVDRYCGSGACVLAVFSPEKVPPPFMALAERALSGVAWYATDMQLDGEGEPVKPNSRHGDGGAAAYHFDAPASPARYLHVVLCLADYLEARGTWIEGGAMFAEGAVAAEFSRPVEFSVSDDVAALTRLSVGEISETAGSVTVAAALGRFPVVRAWANYTLAINQYAINTLKDKGPGNAFANLLALILSPASLYAGAAGILASSSAALSKTGLAGITLAQVTDGGVTGSNAIAFCALAAHGLTRSRTFRGIAFEKPLNPVGGTTLPCRVAVYGVAAPQPHGSSTDWPPACTALPHWAAFMSRAFRDGESAAVPCLALPGLLTAATPPAISAESMSPLAARDVEVVPLASADVSGEVSRLAFRNPWTTGELSSVIVAIVPNGAPQATAATETIDATVSRQAAVVLPNSGASATTKTAITPTFSIIFDYCNVTIPQPSQFNLVGTAMPHVTRTVSGNNVAYRWNSHSSATKKVITRFHFELSFAFTAGGTTYQCSGSFEKDLSATWTFSSPENIPNLLSGTESANLVASVPSFSRSFTATSSSGQQQKEINITFGAFSFTTGASDTNHQSMVDAVGAWRITEGVAASWNCDVHTADGKCTTGYAYAWSNTTAGTVSGRMTVSGRASFTRDGVTYTGDIPAATQTTTVGINNKGTGTVAVGSDTTTRCTVSATLPAIDAIRQFTAPDGRVLSARLLVPAQNFSSASTNWGGVLYVSARGVAIGQAHQAASRTEHDSGQCVQIAQASATVDIDLGTVSLYE